MSTTDEEKLAIKAEGDKLHEAQANFVDPRQELKDREYELLVEVNDKDGDRVGDSSRVSKGVELHSVGTLVAREAIKAPLQKWGEEMQRLKPAVGNNPTVDPRAHLKNDLYEVVFTIYLDGNTINTGSVKSAGHGLASAAETLAHEVTQDAKGAFSDEMATLKPALG